MSVKIKKQYHILVLISMALLFCSNARANNITLEELRATGLPLFIVTTVNGENPTCDYVDHPEGATGSSITNATKVPARLVVWKKDDILYDSGDYMKGESGITIKIRGNTSAYSEKKPYKIKLQEKADLLFRDDPVFKDKDWVLLKGQKAFGNANEMNLNTLIGNKVNQIVKMQWIPQSCFVNLVLNGDYKGVYVLSETVKQSKGRIRVDKNTGYIIERDTYWWNEPLWFETWGGQFTFKYPEADEVSNEQIEYIKDVILKAEDAMWADTYDEFIDTYSFAAWLLAHDLLGSSDGGGRICI